MNPNMPINLKVSFASPKSIWDSFSGHFGWQGLESFKLLRKKCFEKKKIFEKEGHPQNSLTAVSGIKRQRSFIHTLIRPKGDQHPGGR
jgi:hypothetical protein